MTDSAKGSILHPGRGVRPLVAVEVGPMAKTLVPDAEALHLDELCAGGEAITLVVTAANATACCPVCGEVSSRAHRR